MTASKERKIGINDIKEKPKTYMNLISTNPQAKMLPKPLTQVEVSGKMISNKGMCDSEALKKNGGASALLTKSYGDMYTAIWLTEKPSNHSVTGSRLPIRLSALKAFSQVDRAKINRRPLRSHSIL